MLDPRPAAWIRHQAFLYLTALFLVIGTSAPAGGLPAPDESDDLFGLSLHELLDVNVVSSSRVEQSMREAPNAIAVIHDHDIRRAGARSIPEALRLAPGVYVAQMSGNQWVVTIGGFAFLTFANKLLVLIDGVSVYQPLHGGVNWDELPVSIDEIDRIEVIRGPGNVHYGANAVNGVVNIITRPPAEDSPAYANVHTGSQSVRSGGAGVSFQSSSGRWATRIDTGYEQNDGFSPDFNGEVNDARELYVGSLRTAWTASGATSLGFDLRYRGGEYELPSVAGAAPPSTMRLQSSISRLRLDHALSSGGEWYVQASWWRTLRDVNRDDSGWMLADNTYQMDIECQATIPLETAGRHRFTFGGAYRYSEVKTDEAGTVVVLRDGFSRLTVGSAFVHDEWRLTDQWVLNGGVKWEDINVVSPTWQGRVALLYHVSAAHGFRTALANSYRSPSLPELFEDLHVPLPTAVPSPPWPAGVPQELFALLGDDTLEPERVISYELGYRGRWFESLNFDLSYAYRRHDNLISPFAADPGVVVPGIGGPFAQVFRFSGTGHARSHTGEALVQARLRDGWIVTASYWINDIEVWGDNAFVGFEDNTPTGFGRLGVGYTNPGGFAADVAALYSGGVAVVNTQDVGRTPSFIDSYVRIDARLAHRFYLSDGELEVGLLATNLSDEWHSEYVDYVPGAGALAVHRGYFGFLEYRVK